METIKERVKRHQKRDEEVRNAPRPMTDQQKSAEDRTKKRGPVGFFGPSLAN